MRASPSPEWLGDQIGVHGLTIRRIESKNQRPRVDLALKLARFFDVPLDWLADDAADWPPPETRDDRLLAAAKAIYTRHYDKGLSVPRAGMAGLLDDFRNHDADRVTGPYSRQRQVHLERFVSTLGLTTPISITSEMLNRYFDARGREVSAKSIRNERAAIGAFCRWCLTRGYITSNPVPATDVPPMPKTRIVYMEPDEFYFAVGCAAVNELWAVHFAAFAALRVHEIGLLKWSDIKPFGPKPTLTVTGKGYRGVKSVVTLPLHPRLLAVLDRIPKDGDTVFPRMTRRYWQEYLDPLRRVCPTLQQEGQSWHTFRRSFGSILVQRGVRMEVVSKLLRHRQIATTMKHYADLMPEHGRDDLNMI